ncbi:hypothetical protein [Streptomyces sp. LN704]|uniref:hypothetical protein n=1 Tax=Streptomyces sp. LN704 TaxID=3112982 RepID=UPI003710FAE6
MGYELSEGRVTLSGAHAPDVGLIGPADLAAEGSAKLLGDDAERSSRAVRGFPRWG